VRRGGLRTTRRNCCCGITAAAGRKVIAMLAVINYNRFNRAEFV
jgi:hypothetical protein